MDIQFGIREDGDQGEWVLRLNRSLYDLKKSSVNWFWLLKWGLERSVYHQLQVSFWICYIKYSVILTFAEIFVVVSHKWGTINSLINCIKNGPYGCVLTYKGYISKYLGLKMNNNMDGKFELS